MRPIAALRLVVVALQYRPIGGWSLSMPVTGWENVWDGWSKKIVITILIVAAWDYWQRQRQVQRQGHPSNSTTMTKTATMPASHPLLDQLDQQRSREISSPAEPEEISMNTIQQHDSSTIQNDDKSKSAPASKERSGSTAASRSSTTKKSIKNVVPRPLPPPSSTTPPPITNTVNRHPGMKEFAHWYQVETSLNRIYTLGRHDGVQVVPPYIPHSYRGQVSLHLKVTNKTNTELSVYWVDYKGKHVFKGTIKPNQLWTQTTWIDHPWVFEGPDHHDNPTPYLYYIPYRVIPTLPDCPTVDPEDPTVGVFQFSIVPISSQYHSSSSTSPHYVHVQDHVMPFPAEYHFPTPSEAMEWTLQHMSRLAWSWNDPTIDLLQRYLSNIIDSPQVSKYRQLRTRSASSSNKFGTIWNSPLQGLLLAVGFVPVQGYAELGCLDRPLPNEWLQELKVLSFKLSEWQENERQQLLQLQQQQQQQQQGGIGLEQPEGADGFGRAGFGRAGAMR